MSTLVDPTSVTPTTVTRAIIFTDVVRSTETLEQMGVDAWAEAIEHHRRSIDAIVAAAGGVVAAFTGDGYMVAFDELPAAINSALRLQWALWAQRELGVRIGLAAGPVRPMQDGNYLGLAVNRASRLCDACGPGEVLIDRSAWVEAIAALTLPPAEVITLNSRGFREPIRAVRSRALSDGSLP